MGIAGTLRDYLDRHSVQYSLLRHAETRSTARTAEEAHVPGDRVAKPVVIEDANRYIVVVIPATRRLDFTVLHRWFGRHVGRSEEHTSELQSRENLVCRLLLEKKNQ